VINALTDLTHPCQVLADLFTIHELRGGRLRGLRYAWIGDGNNMAHAWMEAAALLGLELRLACPIGHRPDARVVAETSARLASGGSIRVIDDPAEAAAGADVLSTDVWASMGQESEQAERAQLFARYRVDGSLLRQAAPEAIVLHCLPAHRGEEITAEVLEGPQCAAFQQAENRLHTQKAVLELLLGLAASS
jgi:ornithine carbamoyltransferase